LILFRGGDGPFDALLFAEQTSAVIAQGGGLITVVPCAAAMLTDCLA
jgi:hypothetical protein